MLAMFGPRREEQLETLRQYHDRLRVVISELLAKVDEIDQCSKYSGQASTQWAQELKEACSDLVRLGEELPKIEQLLRNKRVKESREIILASCHKAVDIAQRLSSIRQT